MIIHLLEGERELPVVKLLSFFVVDFWDHYNNEIRGEGLRDRSRDPTRNFSEDNDSLAASSITDEMPSSALR